MLKLGKEPCRTATGIEIGPVTTDGITIDRAAVIEPVILTGTTRVGCGGEKPLTAPAVLGTAEPFAEVVDSATPAARGEVTILTIESALRGR